MRSSDQLANALATSDHDRVRVLLAQQPPDDPDTLDALGAAAAAGSAVAIELLVERLDDSGIVRAFVAGALLDRDAVDDVSQETLISVVRSIGSFAGGSRFTTWVHRIARNRVVDHLRRQRSTVPLPEEDVPLAQRLSSMIATRATLRDALAQLPEHYREPVVLRDIEGRSYDEIATALGRSLGTVKSQVARGRALVAAAVTEGSPS